jgi:hypothetical protein
MIILVNDYGLANRLWGIVAALRLTDITGRKSVVMWPLNNGCDCCYGDILQPIGGLDILEYKGSTLDMLDTFGDYNKARTVNKERIINGAYLTHTIDHRDIYDTSQPTVIFNLSGRMVFLDTDSDIIDLLPYISKIKLIKKLQQQIDTFKRDNQWNNIIGMHIRQTDRWKGTVTQNAIEHLINEEPYGQRVFIASDNWKSVKHIKGVFGRTVLHWPDAQYTRYDDTIFERRSESVQQAVCELYLLSQTLKIIGTYSTFATFAATLGNIPLYCNLAPPPPEFFNTI